MQIRREVVEAVAANHIQIGDVIRSNSRDYIIRNIAIDKAFERRYVFDMLQKMPPTLPGQLRQPPPPPQSLTAPEGGKLNRVRVLWEHPRPVKKAKPVVKGQKRKKVAKKVPKSAGDQFLKSLGIEVNVK